MSLRTFHLIFILLVVISADLFGVWSLLEWRRTDDVPMLLFSVMWFLGGLGMAAYSFWFVRKMEKSHIL